MVEELFEKYKRHEKDTGSSEVQIVISTVKINKLKEHLKYNKKDYSARRGLLLEVSKRKRHLLYLKKNNFNIFNNIFLKVKNNDF